jgi:hypothetical protein
LRIREGDRIRRQHLRRTIETLCRIRIIMRHCTVHLCVSVPPRL